MHTGHRGRLRKKFALASETIEDHELVELLLFYSIPRQNTNELAHALIARFGSLENALDADIEELMQVDGIGENSALLIKLVSEFTRRYSVSKTRKKKTLLRSHEELSNYLKSLFIGMNTEASFILLFDNSKHLIDTFILATGNSSNTMIPMQKLAQIVSSHNVSYVILVHNHPGGKAIPSGEDIATTHAVKAFLSPLHILLLDHFIVAGNSCVPILNKDKAQYYSAEEE